MQIIKYSYFSDLSSENGGAIYQDSNSNINISCSIFINNHAEEYGCSIYKSKGSLNIEKTDFTKCYSISNQDGIGGNCLYQDGDLTFFECISSHLCGINPSESSDTAFLIRNTNSEIKFINATSNYGNDGSSSISLSSKTESSHVIFLNVHSIKDAFAIESWSKQYKVEKSNFVHFDHTINTYIIWMEKPSLLAFKECCFFETDNVPLSYLDRTFQTESCLSDINNEKFSYFNSITTNYFNIDPLCDFSCKITSYNNLYYDFHSFLPLILVIII